MEGKNPIVDMLTEHKIMGYMDKHKFASLIPNPTNFTKREVELNNLWQHQEIEKTEGRSIEQLKKKWKNLLRRGIPSRYKRQVILKLYGIKSVESRIRYEKTQEDVFHGSIPEEFKEVPTFCEKETVAQILEGANALTPEGEQALKRLLWIFSQQYEIEYCPHLIHVLSILLLFLSQDETFMVLSNILQKSRKTYKNEDIRWQFTFYRKDFDKTINAWIDSYQGTTLKGKRSIVEHAHKLGVDFREVIKDIFQNFFFNYFNIQIILAIFSAFMNEGIKVVFRYIYSLFKCLKLEIHKIQDGSLYQERVKALVKSFVDVETAVKHAYKYNLKKTNNTYGKQGQVEYTMPLKQKVFYIPHLEEPSDILTEAHLQTIWDWIPNIYKISTPHCIYSTKHDGYSLNTLYIKSEERKADEGKTAILFVVKTTAKTVRQKLLKIFGGFCDKFIQNTGKESLNSHNSFVYSMVGTDGKPEYWPYSEKNELVIRGTKEAFWFGAGGNGPAFQIDANMEQGQTYESETFQNLPLTGDGENFFKVGTFEVFILN